MLAAIRKGQEREDQGLRFAGVDGDWLAFGAIGATLKVNGKPVGRGRDFRVGGRSQLEDIDLVVWIRLQSAEPISLELTPINAVP